jgi:hypothetical protein
VGWALPARLPRRQRLARRDDRERQAKLAAFGVDHSVPSGDETNAKRGELSAKAGTGADVVPVEISHALLDA